MSADQRNVQLPPESQALKRATRALVKAAGGQEAAAAITGKSQPRLSSYGLPNTDDFAPVDVIAALEEVTHGLAGHPIVTRHLAARAGYLLVRQPLALPDAADWCAALGDAVAEFADVQERLLRALPGGVSAEELRAAGIRTQIAEAQERLAMLDALAARALDEGGR